MNLKDLDPNQLEFPFKMSFDNMVAVLIQREIDADILGQIWTKAGLSKQSIAKSLKEYSDETDEILKRYS